LNYFIRPCERPIANIFEQYPIEILPSELFTSPNIPTMPRKVNVNKEEEGIFVVASEYSREWKLSCYH
jgi:hypothetical protein